MRANTPGCDIAAAAANDDDDDDDNDDVRILGPCDVSGRLMVSVALSLN